MLTMLSMQTCGVPQHSIDQGASRERVGRSADAAASRRPDLLALERNRLTKNWICYS